MLNSVGHLVCPCFQPDLFVSSLHVLIAFSLCVVTCTPAATALLTHTPREWLKKTKRALDTLQHTQPVPFPRNVVVFGWLPSLLLVGVPPSPLLGWAGSPLPLLGWVLPPPSPLPFLLVVEVCPLPCPPPFPCWVVSHSLLGSSLLLFGWMVSPLFTWFGGLPSLVGWEDSSPSLPFILWGPPFPLLVWFPHPLCWLGRLPPPCLF